MAKAKQIEFKRTKSANYQSTTVGIVLELDPKDDLEEVQAAAECYVATQLGELPDTEDMQEMKKRVKEYDKTVKLLKKIK